MPAARQYLAEAKRALSVLALLLFVFMPGASPDLSASYNRIGASPAVAASIVAASLTQLCGGGWGDDQNCHTACHACRSMVPLLPPRRGVVQPAFSSVAPVVYVAQRHVLSLGIIGFRPPSRGPPLA